MKSVTEPVEVGDAEGHPMKFAVQLRQDQADSPGGAGTGGDYVHRRGAGSSKVRMTLVGDHLVVGVSMDSGHEAVFDSESVVEHFYHGGETVGGAGSVGHDLVLEAS